MNIEKILFYLLGTNDYYLVCIGFLYSIFGVLLSLIIYSNKRDPNKQNSPIKFSWKFFLNDNIKRLILNLVLIILFLRFTNELIGKEPTVYSSFLIGFISDKLLEILKSRTNII